LRLEEAGVPEELVQFFRAKGISELYPPQEQAVRAGLLDGKSLVVASPTASGKTLLALLTAYRKVKEQRRKVVYLAPLRALASEKYSEFSEMTRFGIYTNISTGDYDSSGESLGRADVIVLTNERFDSIMRHRVSWLNSVGLFIADEVHLAGNDSRGPTLEMILTKALHLGLDAQLLALSATISNVRTLAEWLHAIPVELDWSGTSSGGGLRLQQNPIHRRRRTPGPPVHIWCPHRRSHGHCEGGRPVINLRQH